MKLVCIDKTNNPMFSSDLEIGKIYDGDFVFYLKDEISEEFNIAMEWEKNYFNLKGFSELDWFPTSHFITLERWREEKLNELGIK